MKGRGELENKKKNEWRKGKTIKLTKGCKTKKEIFYGEKLERE